ncbi:MAG: zinc transporter ZupT [Phycisphaerae bacterium]
MENFWLALGLTTFAGLSTGVGSAIAFFARKTNYRFLSVATGFSAGVMLYVSFMEIMPKAVESLAVGSGEKLGNWYGAAAFFGGMAVILLIDRLVPSAENPHEVRDKGEVNAMHAGTPPRKIQELSPEKLHRMGLFTALAIAIHNFPEGLATFMATLSDPTLGLAIAIAIALHNIPEGISVSVPIYFATGNKRRAFLYSLLSGMAEPVGAMVGYLALRALLGPVIMGMLFGGVAGIMVYISLDELLPTSRAYGKGHDSLYGLLAGMGVMAMSLLLLM